MASKPETTVRTDDMNDAVWAGIEALLANGRCWACGCHEQGGEPHSPYCARSRRRTSMPSDNAGSKTTERARVLREVWDAVHAIKGGSTPGEEVMRGKVLDALRRLEASHD